MALWRRKFASMMANTHRKNNNTDDRDDYNSNETELKHVAHDGTCQYRDKTLKIPTKTNQKLSTLSVWSQTHTNITMQDSKIINPNKTNPNTQIKVDA
jgi:hypothetical protein